MPRRSSARARRHSEPLPLELGDTLRHAEGSDAVSGGERVHSGCREAHDEAGRVQREDVAVVAAR